MSRGVPGRYTALPFPGGKCHHRFFRGFFQGCLSICVSQYVSVFILLGYSNAAHFSRCDITGVYGCLECDLSASAEEERADLLQPVEHLGVRLESTKWTSVGKPLLKRCMRCP